MCTNAISQDNVSVYFLWSRSGENKKVGSIWFCTVMNVLISLDVTIEGSSCTVLQNMNYDVCPFF